MVINLLRVSSTKEHTHARGTPESRNPIYKMSIEYNGAFLLQHRLEFLQHHFHDINAAKVSGRYKGCQYPAVILVELLIVGGRWRVAEMNKRISSVKGATTKNLFIYAQYSAFITIKNTTSSAMRI